MKNGGKRPGAGRKKGVPNKATTEARNVFAAFLEKNAAQVQTLWDELESPKDKLWFILQGAEFALPKLGRTEMNVGGALTINVIKRTDAGQ